MHKTGIFQAITTMALIVVLSQSAKSQSIKEANNTTLQEDSLYHFTVMSDLHLHRASDTYTYQDFKKYAIPAAKNTTRGMGNFFISIGDNDSFSSVRKVVIDSLGEDFRFYAAVGNHDVGGTNNHYKNYPKDNWCDAFKIVSYNKDTLKNIANWGPEVYSPGLNDVTYEKDGITYKSWYDKDGIVGGKYTTYSFDENNSHFVILDMYSGVQNSKTPGDGEISDSLYNWLKDDLETTNKSNIFVFGHEPVSTSSTFWTLLKDNNVIAYLYGHTHHYKAEKVNNVWNLNPSSTATSGDHYFFKIYIQGENVELKSYKQINSTNYGLQDAIILKGVGPVDNPCLNDDTPPTLKLHTTTINLQNSSDTAFLKAEDIITEAFDECGVTKTTLSDSIFTYKDAGLKYIVVTASDSTGNSTSKTQNIFIRALSNIESMKTSDNSLNIYPNPSHNSITIDIDKSIDNISIYNTLGYKVLYIEDINKNKKINTNSLKPGLYTIIVKSSDINYIGKFIKE